MDLGKIVRGGPGIYICSDDAISHLDEIIAPFSNVHIITGEKSFAAFKKVYQKAFNWAVHRYDGTSSHEDMDRLAKEIGTADLIIGIGGGRVLDTAKGVNHRLHAQYLCIPTVLGTCSAYTPLAIIYDRQHVHIGRDHFEESAYAVLVDLSLLIHSPKDYFVAGIGDSLAKWYEAESIQRDHTEENDPFIELGLHAALETKRVLLKYSVPAVESLDAGRVSPAFRIVADVIVGISGTVGGFARDSGRASGAHAIHNAMSRIREAQHCQHGVKVAYGLLVLLITQGYESEVEKLLPFYKKIGLKASLQQFGISNLAQAEDILATESVETEIGFYFVFKQFSYEFILNAIKKVEGLAENSDRGDPGGGKIDRPKIPGFLR